MTAEIRRLCLDDVCGTEWLWTDVVSGERGRLEIDRDDLALGSEVVVEIERTRMGWRPRRWLDPLKPPPLQNDEPEPVLVAGRPLVAGPAAKPVARPGDIYSVRHEMDIRSTASRDRDRPDKMRPALVLSVDADLRQVEVSFVFGTNSMVRRNGSGRRIRDWQATGLRKPSVVSAEIHVRGYDDLAARIGHLSDRDDRRLIHDARSVT